MKRFIRAVVFAVTLLAAVLWSPAAKADVISFENENVGSMRFSTTEAYIDAKARELVGMLGEDADGYFAGKVVHGGKEHSACAAKVPGGLCVVVPDLGHVDIPAELLDIKTAI